MSEHQISKVIDPRKYQVFVCTCRASIPFQFAAHPWIVCNERGKVSRYEVLFLKSKDGDHIHINRYPPFQGIEVIPFQRRWYYKHIKVLATIESPSVQRIIRSVQESKEEYPYKNYSLTGPNSNTYAQWVLDQCSELDIELPRNSFGKNYHRPPNNSNG